MAEPAKKQFAPGTVGERKQQDKDGKPKLSKRERFKKYAEARTSRALSAINNVHRMSNTANYEYSPEEAQQIVAALELAVKRVRDGFAGAKEGKKEFRLF